MSNTSIDADFGLIKLHHTANDIQLAAETTVRLAPLTMGARNIDIAALDNRQKLALLRAAWICRGQGLQMMLHTSYEGLSLNQLPWGRRLQSAIATAILEAKFWHQLELTASISDHIHPQNSEATADSIQLSIRHSCNVPTKSRRKLHRLLEDAHHTDVQPPNGIERYGLKSIEMCLSFEAASESHQSHAILDHEMKQASEFDLLGVDDDITTETDYDMFHSDSEELDNCGECEGFQHQDEEALLTELNSSCQLMNVEIGRPCTSEVIELVDAAVRLFICRKPLGLAGDVKMTADRRYGLLAEIVPALFSKDHLQSTSERACFLPTIAHALSHSVFTKTKSQVFKIKLATFGSETYVPTSTTHNDSESHERPANHEPSAKDLYTVMQHRLWKAVQDDILTFQSSRKLDRIVYVNDHIQTANATTLSEMKREDVMPVEAMGTGAVAVKVHSHLKDYGHPQVHTNRLMTNCWDGLETEMLDSSHTSTPFLKATGDLTKLPNSTTGAHRLLSSIFVGACIPGRTDYQQADEDMILDVESDNLVHCCDDARSSIQPLQIQLIREDDVLCLQREADSEMLWAT